MYVRVDAYLVHFRELDDTAVHMFTIGAVKVTFCAQKVEFIAKKHAYLT